MARQSGYASGWARPTLWGVQFSGRTRFARVSISSGDGGRAPRDRAVRCWLSMASTAGRSSADNERAGLIGQGAPVFQDSIRRAWIPREAAIWAAKKRRDSGSEAAARIEASLAGSCIGRFDWNFAHATSGASARRFPVRVRSSRSGEAQPVARSASARTAAFWEAGGTSSGFGGACLSARLVLQALVLAVGLAWTAGREGLPVAGLRAILFSGRLRRIGSWLRLWRHRRA